MASKRVLVTGSAGRVGRAVVREMQDHGYLVTPVDRSAQRHEDTVAVDMQDLGHVTGVMHGVDAVVHMAAIPSPTRDPPEVVFRNNVMSTFNVLEAAALLGVRNVVLASSISALGYAFRHRDFNPLQIPIDETHPLLSQDSYGLCKMAGEELAEGFVRRMPDLAVSSLRFTWVLDQEDIQVARKAREQRDSSGGGAFWTWVDVRDAASACRLAVERNRPGHEAYYIAAPEIRLDIPIEDLLARHYPGDYPVAPEIQGSASPVDCSKAQRLLGWMARWNMDGSQRP
ncbi:MAG: NAD(P)-dependent oxidoreductase [Anaerolineaceae bacterium]|nr:NAD(P)-dependent oxidoreductase [Anaerolineaceae bacterium]